MKTKKYNHMYDIAFAVDTDVEDPYQVSEKEILTALLRRVATVIEGHKDDAKHIGFDIGGEIGYCDSHEDPPEYDTFDGKYHGAESQKGKED